MHRKIIVFLTFIITWHLDLVAQVELEVPIVEEGRPAPGKRVRMFLPNYPKAYYVLYLPNNYSENTKYPLIFEAPANPTIKYMNGTPDETILGYGLSKGTDCIWVSVPYIDEHGEIVRSYWADDPIHTVNFWLDILNDIDINFNICCRIIAGFSRGAISASYIGNYTEKISSKWCAYFGHAHFDGCCQAVVGNSLERLSRIQERKVLLTVGALDNAKTCSKNTFRKLEQLLVPVTYMEIPDYGHHPDWILNNTPEAERARLWFYYVVNDHLLL